MKSVWRQRFAMGAMPLILVVLVFAIAPSFISAEPDVETTDSELDAASNLGRGRGNSPAQVNRDVEYQGAVYGDNFYDLYVNGELVQSDERLLPHSGFEVDVTLNPKKENVFAVLLRDNANTDQDDTPGNTGLEWGERCIGDGGFRMNLSNEDGSHSIVSDSDWVCRTAHVGPVNPEQCFGVGLDFTGNHGDQPADSVLARPTNPIQACRDNGPLPAEEPGPPGFLSSLPIVELEDDNLTPATDANGDLIPFNQNTDPDGEPVFYPEICRSQTRDWFAEDEDRSWSQARYDDSNWEPAIAFTDLEVGYGVPVSQEFLDGPDAAPNEINPNPDNPASPGVDDWGDASFIWQPSLRYDNWVVCRLTVPRNTLPEAGR